MCSCHFPKKDGIQWFLFYGKHNEGCRIKIYVYIIKSTSSQILKVKYLLERDIKVKNVSESLMEERLIKAAILVRLLSRN